MAGSWLLKSKLVSIYKDNLKKILNLKYRSFFYYATFFSIFVQISHTIRKDHIELLQRLVIIYIYYWYTRIEVLLEIN